MDADPIVALTSSEFWEAFKYLNRDFFRKVEILNEFLGKVSGIVWGPYLLLPLLVLTGIYLTARLKLIQIFKLGFSLKMALGKHGHQSHGAGDVTHFQSLMTALAATIGTGNIVGVASAVSIGGPGALVWMWLIAFLGMATKYAEGLLAVKYRVKDAKGEMAGGPMYYIENGLGKNWKWLAVTFAVFGAIAAFGIGNMVQANSVAGNVVFLINPAETFSEEQVALAKWVTGILLAILTGLVVLGGIKSIARTTSVLVPFMAVFYMLGCLIILVMFAGDIPAAFGLIFSDAFTGTSATGGFVGAGVMMAIRMGVARGVFSNESGLGSAPIAAAAAKTNEPAEQASVSMTGTFLDSIVVCTLTGLTLVVTGVWTEGGDAAAHMTQHAFEKGLPGQWGGIIVGIGVVTFAYSTLLGWAYYGEKCIEYLFGLGPIFVYRIAWVLAVIVGARMKIEIVWNLADVLNGLMALPNLVALIGLSGVVVSETKLYFDKQKQLK